MKRSEMIDYIEDELNQILNDYAHKNIRDLSFVNRKANGLLDMIEGFGMLPPAQNNLDDPGSYFYHYWYDEDI